MKFVPNQDITVYYSLIKKAHSVINDIYYAKTKEGWDSFYVKNSTLKIDVSYYDGYYFFTFEDADLSIVINDEGFVFMPIYDLRHENDTCIRDYFDYKLEDEEVIDPGSYFQHHLINDECGVSYQYYPLLRDLQRKFHSTYDFTQNFLQE